MSLLFPSVSTVLDAYTQFGVRADGTDQTARIQAALDSGAAAKGVGGVAVILPPVTPTNPIMVSTLTIRHRGSLIGYGHGQTILQQIAGTTGPVIQNTSHTQLISIRDLRIRGDKTAASASAHGISFDTSVAYDTSTDEYNDPRHHISGVMVENCSGDGIRLSGRGASIVENSWVWFCDGNGLNLGIDSHIIGVDVGSCGLDGILSTGGECRIVGTKCWFNGRVSSSGGVGNGFHISNFAGGQMAGCSAQDNARAGFFFDSSGRQIATGLQADSNNTAGGGYAGIELNNSYHVQVQGHSWDRNANTNRQTYGVKIYGGSNGNAVDLGWEATGSNPPIDPASTITANYVRVNQQEGAQTVAYAASVTPDPYAGKTVFTTLTGNITITNPAQGHVGCELTFVLTQDATGGRTTTFGSAYKASWTPTTTANKINTITFVYDGTNWIQRSATVGI